MSKEYKFTGKQIEAYNELIAACKKCKRVGLTLLGKQDEINAYPTIFYSKNMVCPQHLGGSKDFSNPVPHMNGARVQDCGADDAEYFRNDLN